MTAELSVQLYSVRDALAADLAGATELNHLETGSMPSLPAFDPCSEH